MRLEEAGYVRPALRHYELLADTHPQSVYAPRALNREAVILTDLAREGETENFELAIATYKRLATGYPSSPLAGEALLAIGAICLGDLNDEDRAQTAYEQVLQKYPSKLELTAEATLRLGRTFQIARKSKEAQTWLQKVLAKYSGFPLRCAEAQFYLAETYESLFKKPVWARNAYETVLRLYPQTVWAGKAKERLGFMLYSEGAPRARRVLIEVPPVSSETTTNSLLEALRPIFAARGLAVGVPVVRGWSMEPFFAGYDPANPGRVAKIPFSLWETATTNAGLRHVISEGGNAKDALAGLQSELDVAHLSLVYDGSWKLATGYDSAQDQIFLLEKGSLLRKVAARDFSQKWNRRSELGGPFTLVSFEAPGEDPRLRPKLGPIGNQRSAAPSPTPLDTTNSAANDGAVRIEKLTYAQVLEQRSPLAAPTYLYTLKTLSEKDAHRRALKQAAEWMRRGRSGDALINLEALRVLSSDIKHLAASRANTEADDPLPTETPINATEDETLAREETAESPEAMPSASATSEPTPVTDSALVVPTAPAATPAPSVRATVPTTNAPEKIRRLVVWRNGPLRSWVSNRRGAAAYLDIAAARLNNASLRTAADALRESISALEEVAELLPSANDLSDGNGGITESVRRALEAAAAKVDVARAAESRATDLIETAIR
jgi:tetratricopeptide (TPR) repeat protein